MAEPYAAYAALQVQRDATDAEIKKAYAQRCAFS